MSKFLPKSLVIATSCLCALDISVSASFKADREMSLEEAFENSEEMGRKLRTQIRGLNRAENKFVTREDTGTITKYKDAAVNVASSVGGTGVFTLSGGVLAYKATKDRGGVIVGSLGGAILGILTFVPTAYRNIKNTFQKKKLLQSVFRLATLLDASINSRAAANEKRAEAEGNLIIS